MIEATDRDNVLLQVTTFEILKCDILQFSMAVMPTRDMSAGETSSFLPVERILFMLAFGKLKQDKQFCKQNSFLRFTLYEHWL